MLARTHLHAVADVIHVVIDCAGWSCREGCALVQAPVRPSRQQQAGKQTYPDAI